ncbi:MAG: lytic transglycosylase domain-containing protein [Parvularculaceae bacterium]|nr:lytic transglycosylase domain-containing protein [Parvularculaceae bacterium]
MPQWLTGFWRRAAIALVVVAAASIAPALAQVTPAYLSQSDLAALEAVKKAVAKRDFTGARATARQIADPNARALGEWYYFEAEDPLISVEAADAFLDAHPEWPSTVKIQSHVEKRMTSTLPAAQVMAFFATRDPLTGEGKLQLARAQLANSETDAAILHIKDAWRNNNFTLGDEQRLIANYGGRLNQDDHFTRVDRLLFAREVGTAQRSITYLVGPERRRATVRANLLLGAASAGDAYNALGPEDRADAGVTLAAIRYFRRRQEEPRAIAIARGAPADPLVRRQPARWWEEQQLLMRWALKNKLYADAYTMASHHALEPGSGEFAEAEFNAGWIALRFLKEADRAEKHFAALAGNVSAPISISRGWYWLGRAADAKGDETLARERYAKAAQHIYTFYGQLAAEKIGGEALSIAFTPGAPATPEDKATFGSRPAVAALRMLTELKDDRGFLIFAYHIDDKLQTPGEFRELFDLAMAAGAPHVAVRAGKVATRAGAFSADIAYPTITVPKQAVEYAPAEIILGLSRQESEFNARAFSRAGARGLMQLIPATAEITARKEGLPYRRDALLSDPHYNMTLGSAHLSHLISRYSGSWIMTFAAYNAGPNRVTQWVEAYGDPRSESVDPLDWIEQIPFEETRNYVQRVLENSQIYRSRLVKAPIAGALAMDIERGAARGRIGAIPALSAPGVIPDVQPRIAKLADAVLIPLTAVAEVAPHVRLKPQPVDARGVAGADAAKKTETRGRRQSFRQKNPPPAIEGEHQVGKPGAEQRAMRQAAPKETLETENAAPAPAAPPVEPARPQTPLIMAPVDGEAAKAQSETAYVAEGLAPLAAPATADTCTSYTDFIAETAKEEASADDLNAGALAQLEGGGAPCPSEAAPEPDIEPEPR